MDERPSADEPGPAETAADEPGAADTRDTDAATGLDAKTQKDLAAKLQARSEGGQTPSSPAPSAPPAEPPPQAEEAPAAGVLTVITGKSDQSEFTLDAGTTRIGSSPDAEIPLKGWFKPKVAAIISRQGDSYRLTPVAGKNELNHRPLSQSENLSHGDLLQVSGVILRFTLNP